MDVPGLALEAAVSLDMKNGFMSIGCAVQTKQPAQEFNAKTDGIRAA